MRQPSDGGGDGVSIDLGAIPGIVKSLGDRGRDAQGSVGSIRSLVSTAESLSVPAAVSALTDALRQVSNIQTTFSNLQKDVGTRALELAQAEGNANLADALIQAMKPPHHSSFLGSMLGVVHDVLDVGGFVPGLNELTSGLNALIYIGQGDWKDAALNGVALIPLGKGVELAVKVTSDGAKVARDAVDASKAVRYAKEFFSFASQGASDAKALLKDPKKAWDAALAKELSHDDSLPYSDAPYGETEWTISGKAAHKVWSDSERQRGYFDVIGGPITDKSGEPILVAHRVDLQTGEPLPNSPLQTAKPDGVQYSDGVIVELKTQDRKLRKDKQQIIRFIRAYQQREGRLPTRIELHYYDAAGKVVETKTYPPDYFVPGTQP